MKKQTLQELLLNDLHSHYLFSLVNAQYTCLNNITQLDISTDEGFSKRLQHILNWCQKNQCSYAYEQTFFIGNNENIKVLSRRISCCFHTSQWLDINIFGISNDESILFSHYLDERILNAMSDAFLLTETDIFDASGPRIIYCNSAYTKMSGYEKHEIIGKSPRILQGNGSSEIAKKNIKIAMQNWKSIKQRVVNYKKDGSKFMVELNISPIVDETGWLTHWVSVQRDITNDQADIELVRQSRFILDSNNIGCWYYNITQNNCYFDKVMLLHHQTTAQEFDNKLSTWFELLCKDDTLQFRHEFAESLIQKKHLETEYKVTLPNKETRLLKLNSLIFTDKFTGEEMLTGTCFDVTAERKMEEEVEQQRQISIENAKLASIGQLVAGVGHEINNPLSVITVSLAVAEAKMEQFRTALNIVKPWFQKIDKACLRIAKIVDGLRTVSSIKREVAELDSINLYLDSLETIDFFKNLLEAEGISLNIQMHTNIEKFWIAGEHSKYQQILVNLLSNAKDALTDSIDKSIDCIFTSTDAICELKITDTGCGIKSAVAAQIFDPFVTTKPVGKGTGLGLSITQSIVRLFSGDITFESEINKGTSFSLKFPCEQRSLDSTAKPFLLIED